MRCPIGILISILFSSCFSLAVEIHRPRFARVSISETENFEVLNDELFMTRTWPIESADCVPGAVVFPACSRP
jgi:hypothetical protein